MRKLIQKTASFLARTNQYTKDEEERIEYALRITLFELIKVVGVLVIFSLLGYRHQAAVVVLVMSVCKPFIGGYHEDTQIRCFAATLLIVGSIIYLSSGLTVSFIPKLILSGWTLFCIYQQAPVVNPKMQITRDVLIKRNRILGISISSILVALSLVVYKRVIISDTILWTMVFQGLLMFNKR